MLDWVENRLLAKGLKQENMCDIIFEKVQDRAGTVNRTSVYAEVVVQRVP